MKSTVRLMLAYALVSLTLVSGSEMISSDVCAAGFPSPSFYRECIFILVTTGMLIGLLVREAARRDQIEQKLRKLAIYDPLTGMLNRACFIENLENAVARAKRDATKVGVAFIDLDGFKEVNDAYGHHVGDELLSGVADRIRGIVRAADCAARFGGDEFMVLVHGEPAGGTRRLAERLVEALREPLVVRGLTINASASIGFALYPDHGRQAEQLLRAADMAMYRAKRAGKDSYQEAEPESQEAPLPS